MFEKIRTFVDKMNKMGIPTPFLRDPKTGVGSVTLTLVFISANLVILSLLNSFAQKFKGVDTSNSIEFFMICLGGYLGRKFQKGGTTIESNIPPSDTDKP